MIQIPGTKVPGIFTLRFMQSVSRPGIFFSPLVTAANKVYDTGIRISLPEAGRAGSQTAVHQADGGSLSGS